MIIDMSLRVYNLKNCTEHTLLTFQLLNIIIILAFVGNVLLNLCSEITAAGSSMKQPITTRD